MQKSVATHPEAIVKNKSTGQFSMLTRASILVQRSRDEVFEAAMKALDDTKAKVKNDDKSEYYIEAKSPTSLTRFAFKIEVFVRDDKDGSLLEIYDHCPAAPDKRYLDNFFKAFSKQIPLTTNYGLEAVKDISTPRDPSLICTVCTKNVYSVSFEKGAEKLCRICFEERFGKTVLTANVAEYFGGHKAFLAGGMFSQSQIGSMLMTEKYLIYQANNKDPTKRWEIFIPFKDVVIEGWGVQEVTRRKQITGGAAGIGDSGLIGGGFIQESGKAHHLVVPYIDQNGIPQEPRFGVSSFGGKAIREWSAKLYERVAEAKKAQQEVIQSAVPQANGGQATPSAEEPVRILKKRLAMGEISKEEFEELRKMLES
jgi:hypothetical protein